MSDCDWVCYLQWVVYVPVLCVGVPLNLAALWKLLSMRCWRESTVYLLNLIINDTLLLFSLPFKISAYNREWYLGTTFCSLLETLVYVNIYGSIMLSVCIATHRYVSLHFPFGALHLCSPVKATLVCFFIWVVMFSFSIPVYSLHSNTVNFYCFQNFSSDFWEKRWIVVCMEVVFFSSAVTVVFCSMQVVKILRKLRSRHPNDPKLRNNKSVKIVLSNLLVFLICFIPYHVAAILYFIYKSQGDLEPSFACSLRKFVHCSLCVSSVNCLADGACYYFILKENLQLAKMERRATIHITHRRDTIILTKAQRSENGSNQSVNCGT